MFDTAIYLDIWEEVRQDVIDITGPEGEEALFGIEQHIRAGFVAGMLKYREMLDAGRGEELP